jgi:hypothetical protein
MPPGSVDEAPGRFRNAHGFRRERWTCCSWVTGGTPIGSPDKDPAPMTRDSTWRLGPPDLTLPLPTEFTIGPDDRSARRISSSEGTTESRWVRAVDLMPGTAAMVRAATIAVRAPPLAGAGVMIERAR